MRRPVLNGITIIAIFVGRNLPSTTLAMDRGLGTPRKTALIGSVKTASKIFAIGFAFVLRGMAQPILGSGQREKR